MSIKKILAALVVTTLASPAFGQTIEGIQDVDKAAKLAAKQKDGWKNKLDVGATGASNSASNVVGSADGATYQIGIVLQGEAKLKAGQHAWNNELKLQHAQTRTPVIDQFVKSSDVLDLSSTWLYSLESIDWMGPYARFKLNTQVLEGYDVRSGDINVVKTELDGTEVKSVTADGDITDVTGFFEPLILTEGAGLFANPWEDKAFTLQAKVGAAMQQIIVQEGYAVSGYDADSNTLKQIGRAHV